MSQSEEEIVIRAARGEELIDLRHKVLNFRSPRDESIFSADELPTTLHAGAFARERNVGCATMMRADYAGQPAYGLRGMAVDPEFQSRGIGGRLLHLLESRVRGMNHTNLLWCKARTSAVQFYEKMGWRVVSDEFDVPIVGLHVLMIKELA
jgi:GNAT superfamily N-acetyltransferase